jgi:hypothetical protein
MPSEHTGLNIDGYPLHSMWTKQTSDMWVEGGFVCMSRDLPKEAQFICLSAPIPAEGYEVQIFGVTITSSASIYSEGVCVPRTTKVPLYQYTFRATKMISRPLNENATMSEVTMSNEHLLNELQEAAMNYGCLKILDRWPVRDRNTNEIKEWTIPASGSDAISAAKTRLLKIAEEYVRELCKEGLINGS